ncbi:MAG TPA: plastocyanin/azurin family copper-binding protein [Gaiellaceae bacterium]
MRRTLLVLVVGLAVAAFAVAGCGGDDEGAATDTETTTETTDTGGAEAGGTLLGNVGPGFEISLTMENGDEIAALEPGTYTIEVTDQSDIHNFHLTGTGVDESTTVAETGEQTWEVTLEDGTYTFVCDPHASSMNGSFEVSG